jgi:hypothetical protein
VALYFIAHGETSSQIPFVTVGQCAGIQKWPEASAQTFSIHIRHDRELYSSLGSAVQIRPKTPATQDNWGCVVNFRDVTHRCLKMRTKLQTSVRRVDFSPKEP